MWRKASQKRFESNIFDDFLSPASLAFVAKDWKVVFPPGVLEPPFAIKKKLVFKGIRLVIDCSTNDPDAKVSLLQKRRGGTAQDSINAKGSRITKDAGGQKFVIDPVKSEDAMDYECIASNEQTQEIVLQKGSLDVNACKLCYSEIPVVNYYYYLIISEYLYPG